MILLVLRSRVAKATGGSIVMTLADMEGNETFDPANLGVAEEVVEESVADNDMLMIRGPKNTRAVTGGWATGMGSGRVAAMMYLAACHWCCGWLPYALGVRLTCPRLLTALSLAHHSVAARR